MMDTTKGELSFIVNSVNLGIAYDGIPLDKPLVPCVLLGGWKSDSVELQFNFKSFEKRKLNNEFHRITYF